MVAKVPGVLKKRGKACPKCGSLDVVPIMYGYPMPEAMEAAERGEIELGGCCVTADDPQKHCKACGERFDRPRVRPPRPAERSPKRSPRR
jgi:hypothetical protein